MSTSFPSQTKQSLAHVPQNQYRSCTTRLPKTHEGHPNRSQPPPLAGPCGGVRCHQYG